MPYEIENIAIPEGFRDAWEAAGRHLKHVSQDGLGWLRAHLHQPIAEHLSFRMGNQLFFVFVEVPGLMDFGERERRLLLMVAEEANGVPCVLTMRRAGNAFTPVLHGWGLRQVLTAEAVLPPELVTDALVEMTDWEVHDLAVQVVRDSLEGDGHELLSWQPSPHINPSIWFKNGEERHYVIVRASRWPAPKPILADNTREWAAWLAARSNAMGHFAAVAAANGDDPFTTSEAALPLYRGHALIVNYEGLQPLEGLILQGG